jgi:uncharacterized membrane protein
MSDLVASLGRFHPALVHFPIALVLTALAAEVAGAVRRDPVFLTAARVMLAIGAWAGVAAALAGFARADSVVLTPEQDDAFTVHRIAGIVAPVIAFLAVALGEGVRRSGQVSELYLYRVVLFLAAAAACVAGFYGGEIVWGSGFFSLW